MLYTLTYDWDLALKKGSWNDLPDTNWKSCFINQAEFGLYELWKLEQNHEKAFWLINIWLLAGWRGLTFTFNSSRAEIKWEILLVENSIIHRWNRIYLHIDFYHTKHGGFLFLHKQRSRWTASITSLFTFIHLSPTYPVKMFDYLNQFRLTRIKLAFACSMGEVEPQSLVSKTYLSTPLSRKPFSKA